MRTNNKNSISIQFNFFFYNKTNLLPRLMLFSSSWGLIIFLSFPIAHTREYWCVSWSLCCVPFLTISLSLSSFSRPLSLPYYFYLDLCACTNWRLKTRSRVIAMALVLHCPEWIWLGVGSYVCAKSENRRSGYLGVRFLQRFCTGANWALCFASSIYIGLEHKCAWE